MKKSKKYIIVIFTGVMFFIGVFWVEILEGLYIFGEFLQIILGMRIN